MENPDQPSNKLPGPGVLQICQGWGSINSEGTWGSQSLMAVQDRSIM